MATRTSVGSGLWSAAGTWDTGVPVDGDTVVIAAGHNVQVDSAVDQSAWTGCLGMTVTGGATPGMVYWKDDAVNGCGILKFRTGADVVGTLDTNNGRILANADGLWATATALDSAYAAVIMLEGTATLDCTTLDVRMRCSEPTKAYVRTYGTKYDFDAATAVEPATDVIDLGVAPPSAGTPVQVVQGAGATLPVGLFEDTIYYVRTVVGNTCKLALQNSDATIVDITADGSGTCSLITGYASGSATVNVLDDVTADLWAAGDVVVLCDIAPQNYDQQRLTLDTINAGTIVLSAVVDSTQFPGARIYLSTRNCRILHSSTSGSEQIVNGGSDCIFGEIRATTGTGTTFYCYGINSGSGHTATTITGCGTGIYSSSGHTATTITGCGIGIYLGSGHTATTITGCDYGIYLGSGHTATTITGCGIGIYSSSGQVKNLSGNSYDIRGRCIVYVVSGGVISASLSWYDRNTYGQAVYIFCEHYFGTYLAQRIFQAFGDMTVVTAGAGDPTPNQRAGGNATLLELSNLQSNLNVLNKLIAWEAGKCRIWATASVSKTYRFYVQSTIALTADEIHLIGKYHDDAGDVDTATIVSDETISVRAGLDDWDDYLEVTINPARTGWIVFDIELYKYSAGGRVFIDPLVVIS